MNGIDHYMFGNRAAHDDFHVALSVLLKLVAHAPHSIGIGELFEHTSIPRRKLVRVCRALEAIAVATPDIDTRDGWKLACKPSEVTLEDVFCCSIAQQRNKPPDEHAALDIEQDSSCRSADLILSQAALSTNQIVCKSLRNFPLDRLTARHGLANFR